MLYTRSAELVAVTTWSRVKAFPSSSSPFLMSAKMRSLGSKAIVITPAFWDVKLSGKRTPEITQKCKFKVRAPSFHKYYGS